MKEIWHKEKGLEKKKGGHVKKRSDRGTHEERRKVSREKA